MQLFTFVVTAILFILALLYFLVLRPWQFRWSTSNDEVNRTMMGDEIVHQPHFIATRAVSINAAPAEVWQWIIQIGSARAGFYSIDCIDNANVPNAKTILPTYRKITEDYFIPFAVYHAAFDEIRDAISYSIGFGPLVDIWQMLTLTILGGLLLWKGNWN